VFQEAMPFDLGSRVYSFQIMGCAFDQKSANFTKRKHHKSFVAEEIIFLVSLKLI
jgi:hypothetical protein